MTTPEHAERFTLVRVGRRPGSISVCVCSVCGCIVDWSRQDVHAGTCRVKGPKQ